MNADGKLAKRLARTYPWKSGALDRTDLQVVSFATTLAKNRQIEDGCLAIAGMVKNGSFNGMGPEEMAKRFAEIIKNTDTEEGGDDEA
ncbi:MAG: hypothetical protein K6A41_04145 [Bacteroidales bacterium]|nr:hypothetical protein [Bacteroidales bacterium]